MEKYRRILVTRFVRKEKRPVHENEISFFIDPFQSVRFSESLVHDRTKWFHHITNERLSLIEFGMVESLVYVESIGAQKGFYEMEEIGVSNIEQEVRNVLLCSRRTSVPSNFMKIRRKEEFCGKPLISEYLALNRTGRNLFFQAFEPLGSQ